MSTTGPGASAGPDAPGFDEDYRALRADVGAFALGRDVLRVSGADAVEYLQGQLSQDVAAIEVGASADALILSPQGKLDALVRVSRTGDDELVIDVDAGFGEAVAARLARFKLRVKVVIEPLEWRCVALRGPHADAVVAQVRGAEGTALAPAFAWNGVWGVDLMGGSPRVPDGVRVCSVQAWESVRVEAGIPAMGSELDERTIPAEADLLERAVSFTKGCYTGQELVARLDARGNRVARHLRGVVVGLPAGAAGGSSGPPMVAPGTEIVSGGKVVGAVTSAAWSSTLACPVALGYVHRNVEPPSAVELHVAARDSADAPGPAVFDAEVRALPLL